MKFIRKNLPYNVGAVLLSLLLIFSENIPVPAADIDPDGNQYGYHDENGNWVDFDGYYLDQSGNKVYLDSGESSDDTSSGESSEADKEKETEFIPQEYYDPIQTNEIEGWPQGPAVQAGAVIVEDLDTGAILYSKNADDRYYPASITKIMTTMLALESGIDLDTKVTCGEEVNEIEDDASNLYAQVGEVFTLRQLLYGVMLASANEMANTVAVTVGGSMEGFADLMNQKAAKLGCTGSHFVNPNGLHNDDHYTTADDYARICAEAYENETFREIISTEEYTIPPTNKTKEERTFSNHHKMIREDGDYYQQWCKGGKTGYTDSAWNTLVTYGERDGRRLECIILHDNGAERAVTDTTELLNYGFDNFSLQSVTQKEAIPTFASLMHLKRPDDPAVYRLESLDQPVYRIVQPGIVTVPNGTDLSTLAQQVSSDRKKTTYFYHKWQVGEGEIEFSILPSATSLPYEQARNVDQLLADTKEVRTQQEVKQTAEKAVDQLKRIGNSWYSKLSEYVKNHRMTVILAGVFVLAILAILIIILIRRCTKDARMERKRKKDELQLEREEEAIDRKSAIEIEEELREAMKQERLRQQREESQKAEEKRRELELQENERIVDEAMKAHTDDKEEDKQ